MEEVFKVIKGNPKEFISTLKERFCKGKSSYICNEHWEDFDGTNFLRFAKKSKDGSIEADQIWFTFEDSQEGSTEMVMGVDIKKPDGLLKFKGYAFPYRLDYDWDD